MLVTHRRPLSFLPVAGMLLSLLGSAGCTPSAINAGKLRNANGIPISPSVLLAQADNSQIILSWGPTPGALTYDVLRSPSPSGPFTAIATGISAITYTDTTVVNGTTYYYQTAPVLLTGPSTILSMVAAATPIAIPAGLFYSASPIDTVRDSAMTGAAITNTGGAISSCAISPPLPAGLSLNPSNCTLSGTPTVISPASTYTVNGTNDAGTASTTLSLRVHDLNPVLTYTGSPYSRSIGVAMAAITPNLSGGAITGCTVLPALPTGVSISASDCSISGTPSVLSGATSYTATATSDGGSTTATFSLAVVDAPPTSLSFAASPLTLLKNSAMSAVNSTSSGGAITACSTSGLPAGLSIALVSGMCRISGTPTAVSSSTNYTVTATNSGGSTNATVDITVNDVPPSGFSFAASPFTLTKNVAMTAADSAASGTITSCSTSGLPAGLSIALASGQCRISGTPTAISAATNYTVTATGPGGSVNATVNITVADVAPSSLAFAASPFTLSRTVPMSASVSTSSGGAITACSTSGLPAGISVALVSGQCQLSGTPTLASAATNYTITATNSGGSTNATINITVNDVPPSGFGFADSPITLTKNVAMTAADSAASGNITSCSTSGLPAGISVALASGQCRISGTSTAISAATNYTVTATGPGGSVNATVNITVNNVAPSTLAFADSPFTLTRAAPMSTSVSTSSGGAITACSTSGLPTGLGVALVSGQCQLSGTPTVASAAANYTITATNSGGSTNATVNIAVVNVPPSALSFAGSPFALTKNVAMTAADSTSSGSITSCSDSGLPAGLSVALASGQCRITGTPTALSVATNYTITATGPGGTDTATVNIAINDVAPSALAFASSPFTLTKNSAMTAADSTHSGGTITSCTTSGLPAGISVTLASGQCRISGTPTAASASTNYTITATNSGGSTNATVNFTVNDVPPSGFGFAASPFTLTKNVAMTAADSAASGTITSCSDSGLPAGMSVALASGQCRISGTPTALSVATNYTITATGPGGSTNATVNIAVVDVAPSALAFASSPFTLTKNSAMTAADSTHSGGTITSCTTSGLPAGISVTLASGQCRISGTPTAASASTNYTVTATNSGGSTNATVNFTVNDVPPSGFSFAASPFTLTKNVAMTAADSAASGTITSCSDSGLPAGLSVALASGQCRISGTPTAISAATNYTITATGPGGSVNATVNITVNDVIPSALAFAASPLTLTKNSAMTAANSTHSGGVIISCAGAGLPAGLSVALVTGECQLSGTPTAVMAAANYTINATNSGGTGSATVNITVNDIPPATLAFAASPLSLPQNSAMTAVNSTSSGGTITACSGTLPAGLSVGVASNQCQITGTPTALSGATNYTITASNTGGFTTATVNIAVTSSLPPTPIGLAATGGNQSMVLTWTQASGATGYNVYRNTSSTVTTSDTLACTVGAGTTVTCTDTGLANSTVYYYAIQSTNGAGNSALSTAVSGLTVPAAPTGVTATPGASQVLVSWAAVTGATSYIVKRGTNGGPWGTTVTCNTSTATSCTETGRTVGTTLYYVVYASNASGQGAASSQVSATPYGAATKVAFVSNPGAQTYASGATFSPSLTVAVQDSGSRTVTTSTAAVTLVLVTNTVGGTLSGTLTKNAVNGIATFNDISVNLAATNYSMRATATPAGLTQSLASASFTITAGPASALLFPGGLADTGVCAGPFTVTEIDTSGNTTTNTSGSAHAVTLTQGAGSAQFYTSSDCYDTAVTSLAIANGASSASFYVKDVASESLSVTADGTANGLGSVTGTIRVGLGNIGVYAFAGKAASPTLYQYNLNTTSGVLSAMATASVTTGTSNSFITSDPSGKFVYVVETPNVKMFKVNQSTGSLIATSPTSVAAEAGTVEVRVEATGRYAYALNATANTISMYRVNRQTGVLTANVSATVSTLSTGTTPTSFTLHPTGKFLYVSKSGSNTVSQFKIDQATGRLSAGAADLSVNGPNGITIDGTGKFAYVANVTNTQIHMYTVNATTGGLTPNTPATFSQAGITRLNTDPAGKMLYGSGAGTALYQFSINSATGLLTANTPASVAVNTSSTVGIDSSSKFLYALGSASANISSFTIDQTTGNLAATSPATTAMTGSGTAFEVAGRTARAATGITLTGTNAVGGRCSGPFIVQTVDNVGIASSMNAGAGMNITGSVSGGSALFYSDSGCTSTTGTVTIATGQNSAGFYLKDAVAETFTITMSASANGLGTASLVTTVNPLAKFAYANSYASFRVYAYNLNATTGALSATTSPYTSVVGMDTIAVDPFSRFYYVVSASHTIYSYTINSSTGALTATSPTSIASVSTTAMAVDPTGKFLYALSQNNNVIYTFTINQTTGVLTAGTPASTATGTGPSTLGFDSLGRFVYVNNATANTISMFTINATTGALTATTPATIASDATTEVLVSDPQGKFLYKPYANGVRVYSIDQTTGVLTLASSVTDLDHPMSISFHPGGRYAYYGTYNSYEVMQYSVNPETGELSELPTVFPVLDGRLFGVTIDQSGRFAYVPNLYAASTSDRLMQYRIDQATGILIPMSPAGVFTGGTASSAFTSP